MSENTNKSGLAADIAAAEAALKAAQDQLDAIKARLSDGEKRDEPIVRESDVVESHAEEPCAAPADAGLAEPVSSSGPVEPASQTNSANFVEPEAPVASVEPASPVEPVRPAQSAAATSTEPASQGYVPYAEPYVPPQAAEAAASGQAAQSAPTAGACHAGPGAVPPQQPYYGYPQGYYQQAYAQPVVATKDHVAAGLLAIFLGTLGIHKFYLGYNAAGFIMLAVTVLGSLLTFGLAGAVMWVISIIEGILYLTKTQTEFEQTYVLNKREWF